MKARICLISVTLLLLVTPSCFLSRTRVNTAIDPSSYGRLVPGQSTQDDVLRELGAPADIVQLGLRSAWRYDYTQTKNATTWVILVALRNIDTSQDRVWAFFDSDGKLTHIGGTFEAHDASYKLPFGD